MSLSRPLALKGTGGEETQAGDQWHLFFFSLDALGSVPSDRPCWSDQGGQASEAEMFDKSLVVIEDGKCDEGSSH